MAAKLVIVVAGPTVLAAVLGGSLAFSGSGGSAPPPGEVRQVAYQTDQPDAHAGCPGHDRATEPTSETVPSDQY